LRGHSGIGGVQFLPDGKTVAYFSDCVIRLLDADTLEERWPRIARQWGMSSLAFSADGKTLVTGLGDINYQGVPGGGRLWEAATGRLVREFNGRPNQIFGAALTPDGKTVIGAGWETKVWLWDAASGQELRRLGDERSRWWAVAVSPDGKRLALGPWAGGW